MIRNICVLGVIFSGICSHLVKASEICYRRDLFGKVGFSCKESCCGSLEDKYCCQKTEVGIIAGSVVGVVVFFGIAVSVISCCCCHRNTRNGYVKVSEGPANYGSTTHYDIPRTPSGPQILVDESFRAETSRRNDERNDSDTEVLIDVEIEVESKKIESKPVQTDDLIVEIQTETTNNGNIDNALIEDIVESISNAVSNQDKFDTTDTTTIIVTDTDSPTGRHSYVEIKAEHTFSEDCNYDSEIHEINEDGHLISCDEELISDCTPLLEEIDQFVKQADVYVDKYKSKKILITDLDADITEEISEFIISGEETVLPDFTISQDESISSGLTISQEGSTASDLTVTQYDSILSNITSNAESLLPDLIISEEENLLSESLQKEEFDGMGNQNQPTERVYVYDDQPYNPGPYQPVEAYTDSDPYRSNTVETYIEDGPRTEVFVDDGNQPYDPSPANAYSDNRPYDPGPEVAYAYNQTPGMAAYNQPYGSQPADAYQNNQPADAYQNNQPFENERPVDAFRDNQPYGDDITFQDNEPYSSESVETFEVADDQPSNAYE